MKEKKIGLVELSHCKAFYSSGKILWRDYGKKYDWGKKLGWSNEVYIHISNMDSKYFNDMYMDSYH